MAEVAYFSSFRFHRIFSTWKLDSGTGHEHKNSWFILLAILFSVAATIVILADYHAPPLPQKPKADLLVVDKSMRRLSLYADSKLLRSYKVSLGRSPLGHKEKEGDYRTPEGRYRIDYRKADSGFHRALHISYPSVSDIEVARRNGVSPGSAIMLHGMRNGLGWLGHLHHLVDWTAGCIAVTDWEIEELWRVVPDGTPIEIKP